MARKIPASLAAAYNRAIKRQGDMAARTVRAALAEFARENPDAGVAEAREFAIELLKAAGDLYGNACSQAAFDLQDEIAREFGTTPPELRGWLYEPDEESISKTARYHAGKLADGDLDGFVREISEAARFYAERGANATMIQTAKRQDAESGRARRKGALTHGVRFARVPQGATTCGFCFMLASRGFVYLSEESAGEFDKFHRHCDCRIVPGYPGMELEGYDWAGMHDRWKQCEETIGVEDGWSFLRREDTIKEVDTRDPGWLLTGKPAPVDYSSKPREDLECKERKAIDYLSGKHGVAVKTIKEDDSLDSNFDFRMFGSSFELKSPGGGKHALDDRLHDAFVKFDDIGDMSPRIIICNSESDRPDDEVEAELVRRAQSRFRTKGYESMELVFLSHDGRKMRKYSFR